MRSLLAFLAILALSACASTGRYVSSLNPWIGKPVASVLKQWGPPLRVIDLTSGEKEYVYEKSAQVYESHYGGQGIDTLNPRTEVCKTMWYADKNGIVERVDVTGSHCESP